MRVYCIQHLDFACKKVALHSESIWSALRLAIPFPWLACACLRARAKRFSIATFVLGHCFATSSKNLSDLSEVYPAGGRLVKGRVKPSLCGVQHVLTSCIFFKRWAFTSSVSSVSKRRKMIQGHSWNGSTVRRAPALKLWAPRSSHADCTADSKIGLKTRI